MKKVNNFDQDKVYMTQEAIDNLKERLNHLVNNVRPEVLKELSEARQQGDLSENADYDSARNKQAELESEISNLETILTKVEVIESVNLNEVEISNIVTYKNLASKEEKTIKIVSSSIEVDPFAKIINVAIDTPIGNALLGKNKGDTVTVETSQKILNLKIIKISV